MPATTSFTGRRRAKRTRWSVRAGDFISSRLITVGGIGTIVAVCLVFVFLAWVVAPLFSSARLQSAVAQPSPFGDTAPLRVEIDEYQALGWAVYPDGRLQAFRLDTGDTLEEHSLTEGPRLTAVSGAIGQDDVLLGFEDGSVRFARIGFATEFLETRAIPDAMRSLRAGESATMQTGVVQRTPQGQFRLRRLTHELQPIVSVAEGPVRQLSHVPLPSKEEEELTPPSYKFACHIGGDNPSVLLCTLAKTENMFTGEASFSSNSTALPLTMRPGNRLTRVLLTGRGDAVFAAWDDGHLVHYDTRQIGQPKVAETVELLTGGARLTSCDFILGRETIVCGDDQGGLKAWFRTRREQSAGGSTFTLTAVHRLRDHAAAVTGVAPSQRSRMVSVGYDDGMVRVYHVTTNQMVVETNAGRGAAIQRILMAPKDDGVLAATGGKLWRSVLDPGHPEATLASLFRPVWYEGYSEPRHVWQSSFAGVAPEMKLGLRPLIVGTLKATFYTMLFGAPLALLAAVYTSEFLGSRWRARIKPTIEIMASLPSVVLGFLAALVFAPVVESVVPGILAAFVTVPLALLLGAFVWQLIPRRSSLALQGLRFPLMVAAVPLGLVAGYLAGPLTEQVLFAGDIKRWLDGQIGTGTAGWLMLLLPLSGVVVAAIMIVAVNPQLRKFARNTPRGRFALMNTVKFCGAVIGALLLAWGVSALLSLAGLDPRGSYVATYEQRNALVVGFVMGFAVIPIIYTIADDALSTVPNHLRSASLGCGATPWQTAIRVVIPTAMSGLFSALMIGLGRAVGETMIVLMAGGNTPVEDWNLFNGFRTLSANIAVELPEAVRNSTHYRTLFLAALTLFILTFIINTLAELVRLRFRRRAHQL